MKLIFICITMLYSSVMLFAETKISGRTMAIEPNGDTVILPNVVLENIETKKIIVANSKGEFSVSISEPIKYALKYTGYKSDTIEINNSKNSISLFLRGTKSLETVTVTGRLAGTYRVLNETFNIENISSEGLQKLACCNLSESFENSASVDAGYSDAVSGARQIQLLGLSSVYGQLLSENLPAIRGLSNTYGLSFIPGSWMESIQISKGSASVINGYESITGQINVEYKKPETSDPFFVNVYQSSEGRTEVNVLAAKEFEGEKSTMVMGHLSNQWLKVDHNHDGFMDMPLTKTYSIFNRWNYELHEVLESKSGFRYLEDNRDGGQINSHNAALPLYEIGIRNKNFQAFNKTGFYMDQPYKSLGIINSYTYNKNASVFGLKNYAGTQHSYHLNVIYQTILFSTIHKINMGISYSFDDYNEHLNDTVWKRTEHVPGIYGQYTYQPTDRVTLMAGLRTDYNSIYNVFVTPRFHAKYKITNNLVGRVSAGKGYRSANAIADNLSMLASARTIVWKETPKMESAWNIGGNISYEFLLFGRKMNAVADAYRTVFENQFVMDNVTNVREISLYNLSGKSYSNSLQTELKIEIIKKLDITTAYRYNEVKQTMGNTLQQKPFMVNHRGLITGTYATQYNKWQFDLTLQLNGKAKLPSTATNPLAYQRNDYSPQYAYLLGQITRRFKYIDVYVGGENLTNYTQKNPIVAAHDPFGEYFDASMIWGPISGRMLYGGIRLTIK